MSTIAHNFIRSISSSARSSPRLSRQFHSPFTVLSSPVTRTASPTSPHHHVYEKQSDHSPDPQISHSGTRTYVVSAPDVSNRPYQVPSGAYPTSAPYIELGAVAADGNMTEVKSHEGESVAVKST